MNVGNGKGIHMKLCCTDDQVTILKKKQDIDTTRAT